MPETYNGVKLPKGFQTWIANGIEADPERGGPYAVSKAIIQRTSKKGLRELVCEYKSGAPFKRAHEVAGKKCKGR